MSPLLKHSTPALTAIFPVMGVTGLMMFFHVGQQAVEDLHGWFGLGMIVAASLHLARNWAAVRGYARAGAALKIAFAGAIIGVIGFLTAGQFEGEEGGRGGPQAIFAALERSPVRELAPLFDETPEAMEARLLAAGLRGVSVEASPRDIASASGREVREVLGLVTGP